VAWSCLQPTSSKDSFGTNSISYMAQNYDAVFRHVSVRFKGVYARRHCAAKRPHAVLRLCVLVASVRHDLRYRATVWLLVGKGPLS
jgi:hypothetical protein